MRINNMKFNKKADMSMNTLIMAIIAITVLVVVLVIFTKNVRTPAKEFEGVSESLGSCNNYIMGRECRKDCNPVPIKEGDTIVEYTKYQSASQYDDSCKKNTDGKIVCCQKV